MEIITALINLINKLFLPIGAYIAGKKAKENKDLKEENEKLKKYKQIDDKEIQGSEVYDAKNWD